jgi:prepilin-type N-terminal cleavage/methylation domain-containing protein
MFCYKRNNIVTLKQKAFTLIELLVVIAIIVILLGILISSLQHVRKQARSIVCRGNLHQWALAFAGYADQYDGSFWSGDLTNGGQEGYTWMIPLKDYYGNEKKMLFCPSAKKLRKDGALDPYAAWDTENTKEFSIKLEGSYGMNNWCTNPAPGVKFIHLIEPTQYNFRNINNVKNANRIPLFLDCAFIEGKPFDIDGPPQDISDISTYLTPGNQMKRFCLNRHDASINGLFLDFSTRKIGLKELWTLKWHKEFNTKNRYTKAGGVTTETWPLWMRGFPEY